MKIVYLLVSVVLAATPKTDLQTTVKMAIAERDRFCYANSSLAIESISELRKPSNNSLAQQIRDLILNENCFTPNHRKTGSKPTNNSSTWLFSILSATAINLVSMSGIFFKPLMNKSVFMWILMCMIGMGVGSMCSVSIFQLIPEALEVSLDGTGKTKVIVIMIAIFTFYLIDRFLNIIQYNTITQESPQHTAIMDLSELENRSNNAVMMFGQHDMFKISQGIYKWIIGIPPIVWMVFVSDALHNFVDGVTIGAAFSDSPQNGLSIFLGIFFEELPCELGDFAVFIKSGLTLRTAIIFNVVSASTNYIGLIVGILISNFETSVHSWIYCVAGGMFLYISLGVMLVEMRDIEDRLIEKEKSAGSSRKTMVMTIGKIIAVQILGLVVGFTIQLMVMFFAD